MTTSTAPIHPRTGEPITVESLNVASQGHLPGLVGLEITDLDLEGRTVAGRIQVRQDHLAPNGFLHAATVIALADTICGYGSMAFRAADAIGFTTIELKSNFVGTATSGAIRARGTMLHGGRSTQVWEATVEDESTGQPIAFFRCTQMMLYPKANGTGS